MGAVNIDNTGSGASVTLSSNGTQLLLNGSAIGGGGGGPSAITISNKTGAYTVVSGDLGTIINCTSGTFTVSLTAAATLGSGFNCWIWNSSVSAAEAITIDPNSSETINGQTTFILRRGEGVQIICDGTNWQLGDQKLQQAFTANFASSTASPVASGDRSIAIGGGTASGSFSLAIGRIPTASSSNSSAIGENSGNQSAQAVTGAGAMALGGSYASGTDSFAAACANNTSTYGATGANAVAFGYLARATQTQSVAIGSQSYANGSNSLAIGGTAYGGPLANAASAIAIGANNAFSSPNAGGSSSVALGDGANTASAASVSTAIIGGSARVVGHIAFGAGESSANAQLSIYSPKTQTTDNVAKVLVNNTFASNTAAGTSNQIILPNNSAFAFTGIVVARRQASGGTESAAWKIEGLIRREGTAASTTLVTSTVTAISNVPGWTLALSADTTNGGLAITATGAASTNIRWVSNVQTSEVIYA